MSAGEPQLLACDLFEAIEVDSFSATSADDAIGPVTRQFGGIDVDLNAMYAEQLGVFELAVGEHLLLALTLDLGVKLTGEVAGVFQRDDADTSVAREIDEGGSHLAPVTELQGAFSEAASGDHADGSGCAAIDLNEGDEPLAVGPEGVFDVQGFEAQDGHADAENLAGAHVTMGGFGALEQGFEGVDHHQQIR